MFKTIIDNIFKHKFLFILIGVMVVLLCFYLMIGLNTVFSVSESLKRAVSENMTGDVIIASGKAKYLDVITKDGEKKITPLEKWEELLFVPEGQRLREERITPPPGMGPCKVGPQ